jgi:hypothetical protein
MPGAGRPDVEQSPLSSKGLCPFIHQDELQQQWVILYL